MGTHSVGGRKRRKPGGETEKVNGLFATNVRRSQSVGAPFESIGKNIPNHRIPIILPPNRMKRTFLGRG